MTDLELIQQALFKITDMRREHTDDECYEIEEALRARLAQPDAEPMYLYRRKGINYFISCDKKRHDELSEMPEMFEIRILYTTPPQRTWQGLTDERIDDIYYCVEGGTTALETWREQARAIEAALKEKNNG